MINSFAEAIFMHHPLIEHLSYVLLDVFVSIELTGQAVAFEQKFNYRRPMYEILEYLWKFDKHREQVKVSCWFSLNMIKIEILFILETCILCRRTY